MNIMNKRTTYLILALVSLLLTGCKYDFILPVEVPPITGSVKFSTQIAPIFSTGSKCTSCHKTGGESPDLSAANAYAAIKPGLVNTTAPAQSIIYTFPSPTTGTHSWKKYTAGEAALILAWITEGANNN
jgi:hypothetical protein